MVETKNYHLDPEGFLSLTNNIINGYEKEVLDKVELGRGYFELVRPFGRILMSTNPIPRLFLVGENKGKVEKLLEELKERTGFQIH